jgi:alginate O-acetyltransferase complex protein AlgI
MIFTTLYFTLFLAAVFSLYWALARRTPQNVLLLVASYAFYASWDYRFCVLILTSSLIDYAVGLGLDKAEGRNLRRALLALSLVSNLGLLCFFKYFNFFIDKLRLLSESAGWHASLPTLKILLPVGISFYTFKTLSYTIDVYRRQMKATPRVIEYLAFVSFFPQLLSGPIDRAANLLPQFLAHRRFSYAMAVDGCRQILLGFFKKMVLADNLSPVVALYYNAPEAASGLQLILATVCFAFQIYLDLSAYSDIAIGSAKLLGFDSMRNFAYPYFSQTMAEFWRRWHISLTTWFRDYVYFSLGGVRGTRLRRAFNVVLTFLLSGLWHGTSRNFLIWGGLNGIFVLPEMFRRKRRKAVAGNKRFPQLKVFVNILKTFALACLAWVFFRAESLTQAVLIIRKSFSDIWNPAFYRAMTLPPQVLPMGRKIFLFLALYICAEWLQRHREHPLTLDFMPQPLRWAAYTGLIWTTLYFGTGAGTSTGAFIYFRF